LGNDHYRAYRVRNQQLGASFGQPMGWPSPGHQIAGFGHCSVSAWFFTVVFPAPYAGVAPEKAHNDA
jgi:hypothetical protein